MSICDGMGVWCVALLVAGWLAYAGHAGAAVAIRAEADRVDMGRSLRLDATVTTDDGRPVPNCLVLPYVNQRRWGSHERTDRAGNASFLLPLPNAGPARIRVAAMPEAGTATASWIWVGSPAKEQQAVCLAKTFALSSPAAHARMRVAVDDHCVVYLNGHELGEASGWHKPAKFADLETKLSPGFNTVAVAAQNGTGPGGLLLRLDVATEQAELMVESDATWTGWTECPADWPRPAADSGEPAAVIAHVGGGVWGNTVEGWPGLAPQELLMAGRPRPRPLPDDVAVSNTIAVEVVRRGFPAQAEPDSLIGMQWEPWFTPRNAYWQTAQAVPVVGFYDSYDPDVRRQHVLWFVDLGIDFIMPDWSNHIWGKQHWNERPRTTNEIIHATGLMLETLASMRDEGIPVPKMVLMPGLSNGPPTTMVAINEQLEWVYHTWVQNPRFDGLWQDFDGKPLVVILDTATIALREDTPVDDSYFTVRWMSTQLQRTKHEELGYWSWMDGCLYPIVTYRDGEPEVVTPTPAYFGHGGWTYSEARGRRGGTTYIESFKPALEHRPRVVLLHQWNEFTGQSEGNGHGPEHDIYVDSYSVELSDDLEPVSMTAPGYRGDHGGWGFYYLNLTRALLDVYRGHAPDDTLLAVGRPGRDALVVDDALGVEWAVLGVAPESYRVLLDERPVADDIEGTAHTVDLAGVADGPHVLSVIAQGATTRYPLSYVQDDVPLDQPIPTRVDIPFTLRRTAAAQ